MSRYIKLADALQTLADVMMADRKTEPTISKMEQVETMPCQECKHFHENAVMYLDQCDFCFKDCKYEPKDEPQKSVYCNECKWYGDKQVCGRCRSRNLYAPKDEPQKERSNHE